MFSGTGLRQGTHVEISENTQRFALLVHMSVYLIPREIATFRPCLPLLKSEMFLRSGRVFWF